MNYLLACPNCYRSQPWGGDLTDTACRRCGHSMPVIAMARALVHLFSTAAFDPPHDTLADEDGDEILRWLVGRVWGDAVRVGRHDWVFAGCPATIGDICEAIRSLDGAAFDSLGRLLSAGTPPNVLVRSSESISAAAVARLEAIVSSGALPTDRPAVTALRERLYDILSNFSSPAAVNVLERIQRMSPAFDGDGERAIGAALAGALDKCRGSESPDTISEIFFGRRSGVEGKLNEEGVGAAQPEDE